MREVNSVFSLSTICANLYNIEIMVFFIGFQNFVDNMPQ